MKAILIMAAVAAAHSQAAAPKLVPPLDRKPVVQQDEPSSCAKLSAMYENVSMNISAISAEGLADDSAPRELVRQQRIGNEYARAQTMVALMSAKRCPVPDATPGDYYALVALTCRTDMLKATMANGRYNDHPDTPASCDRTKWRTDLDDMTSRAAAK